MGKYCFGIDVGGTSVKCGLFQTDGVLVEKWEIPTRKENSGEAILPDIAKTILDKIAERKLDKEEIDGVGIRYRDLLTRGSAMCGKPFLGL